MKHLNFSLSLLLTLFAAHSSFAQDGTRGGDDGLDYRLDSAVTLAAVSLNEITDELMKKAPPDVYAFYQKNITFLRQDVSLSPYVIRPHSEVNAIVGGKLMDRKASTGFNPQATVLISRELNLQTSIAELTSILIHEIGHHTGFHDENEVTDELDQGLLLNRFAFFILDAVSKQNILFSAKLYGNLSAAEIISSDTHSLGGMSISQRVGKFVYTYQLKFLDRELILKRRLAKQKPTETPEPDYAKQMHQLLPQLDFKVVDTDRPNPEDSTIFAKVKLTPPQVESFFEVNKQPITLEVPSVIQTSPFEMGESKFYRVTFTSWTKDLFPCATLVTLTPVSHQKPNWKKTIEIRLVK